jgi:hypothetical protein
MLTEPFAETLEPRGESSFVGRGGTVIAVIARHFFDPRTLRRSRKSHALKAARTILTGSA